MKNSGLLAKFLILIALLAALGGGYYWGSFRHLGHDDHAGEGTEAKTQYTCGMHPFIIQDEPGLCPICNMQLTPLKGGAHEQGSADAGAAAGTVSIDPMTTQNMGVRTEPVRRAALARTIRTVGLVAFDEPRQYSVNSKSDGWVERLYVNQEGQHVKKGQPLLEIYSPELVAAQQEYLLALRGYQRLADSSLPQVAENSRRLLEASRTRLRYWDISEKQIAALEQSGEARKTLTLYSPQGGVVTMKKVLEGMRVMAGEELLQIADLSRVWVNADIYEYELPWVKVGQSARVELPFAPDQVLTGKISYIYPTVRNETRTVQARIEFPNPGLALKPEMYANVSIDTASVADALAVPEHAVLKSGKGQTVFVALGEGRFEPRAVVTGVTNDEGLVQILSGLKEGEQVVTSAQFMLDSESKLREAIEKMLAPKGEMPPAAETKDDLDDLFE
ncbi:MAG: efflux RND transporter periplasmic adaptor subunit [Trichloromonas sp.]|jgi:Cu(I)/Ag(I) efflux system membrane fusion protein/cobalt-zinc-cadmium efflux system membrane fusion protein|nr:efflux RND transporter periplasmic adaptor subunit [Trichloromonas sp.]